MMKYKSRILLFLILFAAFLCLLLFHYENKQNKDESSYNLQKKSESAVNEYRKKFDSLHLRFTALENQKQKVKYIYLKGKESVKYITAERTENYTDSACQQDVFALQNLIGRAENLINTQDSQVVNLSERLDLSHKISEEKDHQIYLLQSKKPKPKPWGLGAIAGYGIEIGNNSGNKLVPFFGIGISYGFFRF